MGVGLALPDNLIHSTTDRTARRLSDVTYPGSTSRPNINHAPGQLTPASGLPPF